MLKTENALTLVIDMQEKLTPAMAEKEKLVRNICKLMEGMQVLGIPLILTEQYPKGLGPTIPEISRLAGQAQPISKTSFSCLGSSKFRNELKKFGRKQVIVCGIESHVCIYQTAKDLVSSGYEAFIATDAISSRTLENKFTGLNLMGRGGAVLTSVEAVLFELLETAENKNFKAISRIVK